MKSAPLAVKARFSDYVKQAEAILLGGSGKKRQRKAIAVALRHWADYKRRKG